MSIKIGTLFFKNLLNSKETHSIPLDIKVGKTKEDKPLLRKIARKFCNEINIKSKMQFNENCSYHLYWILVKNRQKFRQKLLKNGIETGTHYKPIHLMKMYRGNISLPITESIGKQIVTIPIHPNLKKSEIEKIIRLVNNYA